MSEKLDIVGIGNAMVDAIIPSEKWLVEVPWVTPCLESPLLAVMEVLLEKLKMMKLDCTFKKI